MMLLLQSLQSCCIFLASLNTSIDQDPDPMPGIDEDLYVIFPPIAAPPRRSVRESLSSIPDDYITYLIEGDLPDIVAPINYHQAMNNRFAV